MSVGHGLSSIGHGGMSHHDVESRYNSHASLHGLVAHGDNVVDPSSYYSLHGHSNIHMTSPSALGGMHTSNQRSLYANATSSDAAVFPSIGTSSSSHNRRLADFHRLSKIEEQQRAYSAALAQHAHAAAAAAQQSGMHAHGNMRMGKSMPNFASANRDGAYPYGHFPGSPNSSVQSPDSFDVSPPLAPSQALKSSLYNERVAQAEYLRKYAAANANTALPHDYYASENNRDMLKQASENNYDTRFEANQESMGTQDLFTADSLTLGLTESSSVPNLYMSPTHRAARMREMELREQKVSGFSSVPKTYDEFYGSPSSGTNGNKSLENFHSHLNANSKLDAILNKSVPSAIQSEDPYSTHSKKSANHTVPALYTSAAKNEVDHQTAVAPHPAASLPPGELGDAGGSPDNLKKQMEVARRLQQNSRSAFRNLPVHPSANHNSLSHPSHLSHNSTISHAPSNANNLNAMSMSHGSGAYGAASDDHLSHAYYAHGSRERHEALRHERLRGEDRSRDKEEPDMLKLQEMQRQAMMQGGRSTANEKGYPDYSAYYEAVSAKSNNLFCISIDL